MEEIASSLWAQRGRAPAGARPGLMLRHDRWSVAETAYRFFGEKTAFFLASNGEVRRFGVVALREKFLPDDFSGEKTALPHGGVLLAGNCDAKNAAALRRRFRECAPSTPEKGKRAGFFPSPEKLGETEDFPVFLAEAGKIGAMLDEAAFSAFSRGLKHPFGVGAEARSAREAQALFGAGASWVVLKAAAAPAPEIGREEYADRLFLAGKAVVAITEKDFSAAAFLPEGKAG